MPELSPPRFAPRRSVAEVEEGQALTPKFDADGLIPCVVTDADAGDVLMFGFMNAESLALTIETGEAHFWSRSRKSLWKKGETSGRVLTVTELRVDCDQDAIWLKAKAGVDGASCHLGYHSCFFRSVPLKTGAPPQKLALKFKEAAKVFDPKEVYGSHPKADK